MRRLVSPLDGIRSPFGPRFGTAFSPASLFAAGEQGVWYDPSDFTTMFQDSAGTTPVTAVEQPVGLILDKSKGLAIGSELVTNGTFDTNTTGWTAFNSPTTSIDSQRVKIIGTTGSSGIWQDVTLDASKSYEIKGAITTDATSAITCVISLRQGGAGTFSSISGYSDALAAPGASTNARWVLSGRSVVRIFLAAGYTGSGGIAFFDNISVRELPGNHATQATSASRPVLSARVNLLTYSEQFDNAAWTKLNATITANQDTAPDGTLTADLVAATAAGEIRVGISSGVAASTSYTATISGKYINANGRYLWFRDFYASKDTGFDLQSGVVTTTPSGVTASISLQANGYYRCVVSWTTPAAPVVVNQQYWVQSASGSNVSGGQTGGQCYIWGADLRVTNDGVGIPAYQRVNTSTDYDTTGFPLYLRFDGTDDSLATASINFSVTDKMSVFAGVRKIGTSQGILVETSAGAASNSGTFFISAPNDASPNYAFLENGGGNLRFTVPTTYTSPITNVLSCGFDLGTTTLANSVTSRINATLNQTGLTQTAQTTGNFGTYSLFVGRRNQVTLPFNGRLYSLIVRGAQSTATEISNTETWVNGKTMAY